MPETLFPPFTVTRAAIAQIDALGGGVRIDVEKGGCCGDAYEFSLYSGEPLPDGDERYGCPGAWLVVTERVAGILPGAILDYAGSLKPPRFRILRNPNTSDTCPCKRSFGQEWPGPKQAACRAYAPMPWDESYEPPAAWKRQTGWEGRV